MKKTAFLLFILKATASTTIMAHRTINAGYNKVAGKLNTMFTECVGAGRANEGL